VGNMRTAPAAVHALAVWAGMLSITGITESRGVVFHRNWFSYYRFTYRKLQVLYRSATVNAYRRDR
jgi:hypothetical protein